MIVSIVDFMDDLSVLRAPYNQKSVNCHRWKSTYLYNVHPVVERCIL